MAASDQDRASGGEEVKGETGKARQPDETDRTSRPHRRRGFVAVPSYIRVVDFPQSYFRRNRP